MWLVSLILAVVIAKLILFSLFSGFYNNNMPYFYILVVAITTPCLVSVILAVVTTTPCLVSII